MSYVYRLNFAFGHLVMDVTYLGVNSLEIKMKLLCYIAVGHFYQIYISRKNQEDTTYI